MSGSGLDCFQEFGVGVVDELFVGFGVGAGFLFGDVTGLGVVGCDDGATALKVCLIEQLEIAAGLIDAGGHQHGGGSLTGKIVLGGEVINYIHHNPVDA